MAFDPDAYLAENAKKSDVSSSKGGFDPDAYLAANAPKSPDDEHSTEEVSPAVLARIPPPVSTPQNVAPAQQTAPPAAPGAPPGQVPPQNGQPTMPTPEKPLGGAPGLPEPKKRPTLSMPEETKAFLEKGTEGGLQRLGSVAAGAAEVAAQQYSGLGASIVGGYAGAGRAMYGMATGEGFDKAMQKGSEWSQGVQEAGTYSPRTDVGKGVSQAMSLPMDAASSLLGKAGGKIGAAVGPKTEAALSTIGENVPAVASTLYSGASMAKGSTMKEKAASKVGPEKPIFRDLTPEQQTRYDRLVSQGIEPTLANVTRDPAQFRYEEQTAATEGGKALNTRRNETNKALIEITDQTDKLRAGASNAEGARLTGHSAAVATERNMKESLKNASDLYEVAKASGETKAKVDTKPLRKYLADNESMGVTVKALDSISREFDRLEKLSKKKGGMTIDDYEILYKKAGQLGGTDNAAASFMREVKKQINADTAGVGGDLYRTAREARVAHGVEFEDRGAIARLWEKKPGSRTDYKLSNEEVFNKSVINSSLEELKDVTNSLLKADPKTHPESWQAVRNFQAQAIEDVLQKAIKGENKAANPEFSEFRMKQAMSAYGENLGKDKLTHLLGKDAYQRMLDILQSAKDVKSQPNNVRGSGTVANALVLAERQLKKSAAQNLIGKGVEKVAGQGSIVGAVGGALLGGAAGAGGGAMVGAAVKAGYKQHLENKVTAAREAAIKESLNPRLDAPDSPKSIAATAASKKEYRQYAMDEAKNIGKSSIPATIGVTAPISKKQREKDEEKAKQDRHEKRLEAIRMEDAKKKSIPRIELSGMAEKE